MEVAVWQRFTSETTAKIIPKGANVADIKKIDVGVPTTEYKLDIMWFNKNPTTKYKLNIMWFNK
ncbi:MAG: hypothetical protein IJ916_07185 [Paludibacteraceae bacterium]|nr:hypothetical protein [Paludibacteraceae bacterium]